MTINIQLEPNEVEQVLAAIGQEKINDRIGLWMKIREQALTQVAQKREPAAESEQEEPNRGKPVRKA